MIDNSTFLVTRDIAVRCGLLKNRYRIQDGRYVLDARDLSRMRLTSDELLNGVKGLEKVSQAQAQTLIARAGFVMGDEGKEAAV